MTKSRASSPRVALALAALLALLAAALAADLVPARLAFDAGRERRHALDPRLAAALERAEGEVVLAWFGTDAAELPPGWRDVPGAVDDLERALASSPHSKRVRIERFRPESDADAARFAARLGLSAHAVRTRRGDGWSETQVWSALRIADGARGAAVLPALEPDLAPRLQELVAAELDALRAPRKARIAVAAPDEFLALRTALGAHADVFDLDFERTARVPDDADVLVWLDPRAATSAHVRELERFLAAGGSAWIAAAPHAARIAQDAAGARLERAGADDGAEAARALFAQFGVELSRGVVLEERGAAANAKPELALRVASIGEHQDFRALASEPGGTVYFVAPSALEPDATRLDELALDFRALACSNAAGFQAALDRPQPLAELAAGRGRERAGAQVLAALLAPRDPWRGALVLFGSSSPFGDRELGDAKTAHAGLVDAVRAELASTARAVRRSVARERTPPLAATAPGERLVARLLVAGVPALLALGLALSAAARGGTRPGGTAHALLVPGACALAACAALAWAPSSFALDTTRERAHAAPTDPDGPFARLAAEAERSNASARLDAFVSPRAELPPELRAPLERAVERVRAVAELSPRFSAAVRRVSAAEDAALAPAAARAGPVPALRATSTLDEVTEVRAIRASLVVSNPARPELAERIDLGDARAAEDVDLALAAALERVLGGPRRVVAFAGGEERLSPAEALLEFERRGRFAPRAGARFELARAALVRAGYVVVDVDPERPVVPDDAAALVWLAPRRDAAPLGVELARVLHRGGAALVALQTWKLRPMRGGTRAAGTLGLWPEPQFPELDEAWLPRLGVTLPREVVSDARKGALDLDVKVQLDGGRARIAREHVDAPVIVRAAPTSEALGALAARALPELVLALPSRIELDRVALAQAGLAATPLWTTSPAAWTSAWSGGDLGADALTISAGGSARGPFALGVLLRGPFPGPEIEPKWSAESARLPRDERSAPGALVLLGSSEAFTNDALRAHPEAERALVQSVAALASPRDVAVLAGARPAPAGLPVQGARERLSARVLLAGAVPLALLLAAVLHGARRRRAALVVGTLPTRLEERSRENADDRFARGARGDERRREDDA